MMARIRAGIIPYSPGGNPYQGLLAESIESAGVEVVRIPNRKFMPISHALSLDIDILHMNWPHSFYTGRDWLCTKIKRGMYILGLRKLKKHPFVYSVENLVSHEASDEGDEKRMIQKLIDCCDGIVTMSATAEGILRNAYRVPEQTRIAVIPHGHYMNVYPNTLTREEARNRLGLTQSAKVLLALGRIRRYKGLDTLIDAYRKAATPESILFIAGDASDAALLAELQALALHASAQGAEVRVHPGEVAEEELQIFFNASDIVALPYRDFPMNPGGLLLAMSFGRCVVAPRKGSIPETACPDGLFAYDPDKPDGLAGALAQALSAPDLLKRGETTLKFTREKYDWHDIGRRMRKLYEDILAGPAKRGLA